MHLYDCHSGNRSLVEPLVVAGCQACTFSHALYSVVYQLGTLMPARESRVVEYKAGGGNYTSNILPTHINKYGSAFLNSSGGTLCIGVNDDGMH